MRKKITILIQTLCIITLAVTVSLAEKASEAPDTGRIQKDIQYFTKEIGPRPAGSDQYVKAMQYIWDTMSTQGYDGNYQSVRTPANQSARNLDFLNAGTQNRELILAAPVDSEDDSTGAASSASATALLLELSRFMHNKPYAESIHFLFLGAELDQYGYEEGRYYSSNMFAAYQKKLGTNFLAGVIYLVNPGAEGKLIFKKVEGTPTSLSDRMVQVAERLKIPYELKEVPRWQPMLPFEDAGINTLWIERVPVKEVKKGKKESEQVSNKNLAETAQLLTELIQSGI